MTTTTPPSYSFIAAMKMGDNYGEFEDGEGTNAKEEAEKEMMVEKEEDGGGGDCIEEEREVKEGG